MSNYGRENHVADAFAYRFGTQASQRDPRDLNAYTAEEYNRLVREAEAKAEAAVIAAMTPAQKVNKQLETVASRFGPLRPWST